MNGTMAFCHLHLALHHLIPHFSLTFPLTSCGILSLIVCLLLDATYGYCIHICGFTFAVHFLHK